MNDTLLFINALIKNFSYAFLGGVLTLGFMLIGAIVLDKLMNFDTAKLLQDNNVAVGVVYGCLFIAIGIAMGLVIGLSLN